MYSMMPPSTEGNVQWPIMTKQHQQHLSCVTVASCVYVKPDLYHKDGIHCYHPAIAVVGLSIRYLPQLSWISKHAHGDQCAIGTTRDTSMLAVLSECAHVHCLIKGAVAWAYHLQPCIMHVLFTVHRDLLTGCPF